MRSSIACDSPDWAPRKWTVIGASGPPKADQLSIFPVSTRTRSVIDSAVTGLPASTIGTIASSAITRERRASVMSPNPASRACRTSSGRISRMAMTMSASSASRSAKPSSVLETWK